MRVAGEVAGYVGRRSMAHLVSSMIHVIEVNESEGWFFLANVGHGMAHRIGRTVTVFDEVSSVALEQTPVIIPVVKAGDDGTGTLFAQETKDENR